MSNERPIGDSRFRYARVSVLIAEGGAEVCPPRAVSVWFRVVPYAPPQPSPGNGRVSDGTGPVPDTNTRSSYPTPGCVYEAGPGGPSTDRHA
jgi:hypothetical protein